MSEMNLDPEMNQPQWFPVCLREIMTKATFLTSWEWGFVGRIRPKIERGIRLNDWEQNKLAEVHKYVMRRKFKPVEKEYVPKGKR